MNASTRKDIDITLVHFLHEMVGIACNSHPDLNPSSSISLNSMAQRLRGLYDSSQTLDSHSLLIFYYFPYQSTATKVVNTICCAIISADLSVIYDSRQDTKWATDLDYPGGV